MTIGNPVSPSSVPTQSTVASTLASLSDASSPAFGVLSTAAVAGLTLVEHRKLGPVAKAAYRLAYAGFAGLYGVAITRQLSEVAAAGAVLSDDPELPELSVPPAAAGSLAAGATLGLADLNEMIDGRIVDWVRDRGVSHPRALLAVGAAGMMGALWYSDRKDARRVAETWEKLENQQPAPSQPLPPQVLALLDTMLRQDLPGAEALRRQLDSVQHCAPEPGFVSDIQLEVDPQAPQAIPYTQVWPVQGRFTQDGVELNIELQIYQGRLEMISVMLPDLTEEQMIAAAQDYSLVEEDQERAAQAMDTMTQWPDVSEVRFVLDGES